MRKVKLVAMSMLIIASLLASAVTVVMFRPTAAGPAAAKFIYVVKFICNVPLFPLGFSARSAEAIGLVPGMYQTDINIHNPSFSASNVTISEKFTVSIELGTAGGFSPRGPTVFSSIVLAPDAGNMMECVLIISEFRNQGVLVQFPLKGFVVLTAPVSNLNVVAEYSSQSFNSTSTCVPDSCGSTGTSLDVVTIAAQPFVP